jgi:hypothetical protein
MFTTGFGFSAAALGQPDFGLLTMSETVDRVRHIVDAVTVPVVADMDTGYGNPLNTRRTVRECVTAGAAGIILEDQQWPKKCGHFEGKKVIPAEDHVAKLRAAVDARDDDDLVIIARTDARAPLGLDEAIRRGKLYRGRAVIFEGRRVWTISRREGPIWLPSTERSRAARRRSQRVGSGEMVVFPLSAARRHEGDRDVYARLFMKKTTAGMSIG